MTALYCLVRYSTLAKENPPFMLRPCANPNTNLMDEHKTVLAAAVEFVLVEMPALLLQHGARLKGSGEIGLGAGEQKVEMAKFFLEQGADIKEIGPLVE